VKWQGAQWGYRYIPVKAQEDQLEPGVLLNILYSIFYFLYSIFYILYVILYLLYSRFLHQWRKQLLRIFVPEFQINEWINPTRSAVSKKLAERFFLRRQAAKFWKRDISSASQTAFPGVLGDFFGCSTPSKRGILVHKNSLACCHLNSIVTALIHVLWRVLSDKVIWVLGHCWVDTPFLHTFQKDSVLFKLFAPHFHGHAEWFKSCEQKRFS